MCVCVCLCGESHFVFCLFKPVRSDEVCLPSRWKSTKFWWVGETEKGKEGQRRSVVTCSMYATLLKRSAVGRKQDLKRIKSKCTVQFVLYFIYWFLFFLPFCFLLQISCFLIIVAIVRVGGNNVGSAFVKPRDEYMYWCDAPTVPSFTCSLYATVTPFLYEIHVNT